MEDCNPLDRAVRLVGVSKLARELGISHQAVRKWQKLRRLPRTEWTGETNYSARLAELTANAVTREQLLAHWPAPAAQAAATEDARDAA